MRIDLDLWAHFLCKTLSRRIKLQCNPTGPDVSRQRYNQLGLYSSSPGYRPDCEGSACSTVPGEK